MEKVYKKYYQVLFENRVEVRELKSNLPFSVEEGLGSIKNNSPKALKVKHISAKAVEKLKKEHEEKV
jgi:hypothetical protein